jgi:predicted nucleotidyltransferase
MDQKQILEIIKKEKPFLKEHFGLLRIGIFGSYAKGEQGPESDIDFLVELSEPRFDFLAGLQIYLEKRLGRPVEIIRKRKNISERFLARIEKDINYV